MRPFSPCNLFCIKSLTFNATILLPGEAHQPGVLFSFSCLSYNRRANWSDETSYGLPCPVTILSAILPLWRSVEAGRTTKKRDVRVTKHFESAMRK